MNVQTLALANEGTTVGSEVENLLLGDLPDSLINSLDIIGNLGNVLDRTVVGDDTVLHFIIPETTVNKVTKEPRADDLEFTGKDTTSVNVAVIIRLIHELLSSQQDAHLV